MRAGFPAAAVAFAVVVALDAASATAGAIPDASVPACVTPSGSERAVTRIIDAETFLLDDGSEVRLAGLLAPRRPLTSASDAPWAPERDAAAALSELVLGNTVVLAPSGHETDRYGRRIAQAVVVREGRTFWVQGALLRMGHARAAAPADSVACLAEMLALEAFARATTLGLWANGAYAVRSAARAGELMRWRSTYQIVEGRVRTVGAARGAVYFNFGADWRADFTAGLSRRKPARAAFAGFDSKALQGRRVRVRGWIERRNGPFIEIVDPAQIEVLDADPGAAVGTVARPDKPADAGPTKSERPATVSPGALDL